ncbi:MAG: hypothetical protein JWO15_3927 [Sphingomonadales bacterium]|nr:hypothetical protein [Sphingomonadales bacterium]
MTTITLDSDTKYGAQRGPNMANTRAAIEQRHEFNAGNFCSRWAGSKAEPQYDVYSYQTVIAYWNESEGWVTTDHRYSTTTSRHQSTIRYALHGIEHTAKPEPIHPYFTNRW